MVNLVHDSNPFPQYEFQDEDDHVTEEDDDSDDNEDDDEEDDEEDEEEKSQVTPEVVFAQVNEPEVILPRLLTGSKHVQIVRSLVELLGRPKTSLKTARAFRTFTGGHGRILENNFQTLENNVTKTCLEFN